MSDATRAAARLPSDALRLFDEKGAENALNVRRVIQVAADLAGGSLHGVRILDLGCGEGVYSIEAGLRGASVVGIDARPDRMRHGERVAREAGLSDVRFELADVRGLSADSHGTFDVVFLLGLLYHLDVPDVFELLKSVHAMAERTVIIDTHFSLVRQMTAHYDGKTYHGRAYREHDAGEPPEVMASRVQASLDNVRSFWFTRESLVLLLRDIGFTSVYECQVPTQPVRQLDRVTLVALKGTPLTLAAYPWANGLDDVALEKEIRGRLRASGRPQPERRPVGIKGLVDRALGRFGYEIRRR